MRDYGTAAESMLASLSGIISRHLVWVQARRRDTGLVEAAGFWNGLDVRQFTVGEEARNYAAAGSLLGVDPIRGEVGLNVQMHTIRFSSIPSETVNLINIYDLRGAPIEVHRVLFDPVKAVQVGHPVRVIKGWVEEMPLPRAAEGQSVDIEMTIASAARALTRTLALKKSDAAQRRIDPTDRGREYSAVSGSVPVFWGSGKSQIGVPPTTTAAKPAFDLEATASRGDGDNRK
ncbi:hypothetical protein [Roseovarius mucosus]|uniref:hypothetical protein n=1 Tax=Roseovarius mucosus TaxID=215743 RepID=UPI0035CF76C0